MSLSLILRAALAALAVVLVTAVSNCGAEAPGPVPGQQQPAEDEDGSGDDGSDQGGEDDGAEGDDD